MEALVVVDMQPKFDTSNSVIDPVSEEIKRAMEIGAYVIFVEYYDRREHMQRTHKRLIKLLKNYRKKCFVEKNQINGGTAVKEKLEEMNLKFDLFRIVGVNFNACVKATAQGLASIFPESHVQVIKKASNPEFLIEEIKKASDPKHFGEYGFPDKENLKVI